MQDIIEGLKMREIKRAVNVYKDRKIEFIEKKNVLKTSLLDIETNKIVNFDMPYKGYFNSGLISVFLVEKNEFKTYESKTINDFLDQLKICGGVTQKSNIFVTENHNYVIQHELQHVFDNLISLKNQIWEHEYRAFLASLIYSKDSSYVLLGLTSQVKSTLKEIGIDFFKNHLDKILEEDKEVNLVEPHEVAILKLISDLDKNIKQKATEEKIRETSKMLLDKNYVKHTGGTYEEIRKGLEKHFERY